MRWYNPCYKPPVAGRLKVLKNRQKPVAWQFDSRWRCHPRRLPRWRVPPARQPLTRLRSASALRARPFARGYSAVRQRRYRGRGRKQ
jgi:hypothetical protein